MSFYWNLKILKNQSTNNNNITIDNELKKELDNLLKEISCLEIKDVNDKEDIDKSITDIKKYASAKL